MSEFFQEVNAKSFINCRIIDFSLDDKRLVLKAKSVVTFLNNNVIMQAMEVFSFCKRIIKFDIVIYAS